MNYNFTEDTFFRTINNIFIETLKCTYNVEATFHIYNSNKNQSGVSSSGFGTDNIMTVFINSYGDFDNIHEFTSDMFFIEGHEFFHEFRKRFPEKLEEIEAYTFLSHNDIYFYMENYNNDITEIMADKFSFSFTKSFIDKLSEKNILSNEDSLYLYEGLKISVLKYYKNNRLFKEYFENNEVNLENIESFFDHALEHSFFAKKHYKFPSLKERLKNPHIKPYKHNINDLENPLDQLKVVTEDILEQSDYFKLKAISGSSLIQSSPHLKEYRDLLKDRIEEERNKPEIQKFLDRNSGRF